MPLTATLAPPRWKATDSDNAPAAGAKLYSYEAGSVTPLALYANYELTTALSNPVIADASGLFPQCFLLRQAYKLIVKDASDNLLWEADDLEDVGAVLQDVLTDLETTVTAQAALTQTKFATSQLDATSNTTLANITGLTGFTLAAAGVYKFEINLSTNSTVNGGVKVAFKYTTAVPTNLESVAQGFTASAVAVQHVTSITDQATLFGATSATINVRLSGRITITTAGTLAVQMAQNVSHSDTSSVLVGSWATFAKVS